MDLELLVERVLMDDGPWDELAGRLGDYPNAAGLIEHASRRRFLAQWNWDRNKGWEYRQRRGTVDMQACAVAAAWVGELHVIEPLVKARHWPRTFARYWIVRCRALAKRMRVRAPMPYYAVCECDPPASMSTWFASTTVRELAHEFNPSRFPVLADALEECGCLDEQLLRHLRDRGRHSPNCWAFRRVR